MDPLIPPTAPADHIDLINIEEEMQRDYIDYSMSVIIGRALPDARDGLKPVNRRILYAMKEGGWLHSRPFVKCARVVGEVMGKFHPHGDSAVYDALVRQAQTFSMRYPTIDSQGNFGSIDGDPPAAYRYTECRLNRLAEDLLADIDKETVDMRLNFDEKLEEPTVLPCRIPHLLANGSTGIAVGMATNIPPHNLDELIEGLVHLIETPDCSIRDLMQFIKGPDFPTGAKIRGVNEIIKMYETGRGLIRIRGIAEIEEDARGKETIIITELPYTVNKANLVIKVAELVREKKIEGISDVRDESDKDGIRVVIEIKRNAMASIVLNNLYKQTFLQTTFGATMLAIDHGQPKVMNLKEMLKAFLDHRFDVITRRTQFELAKAEARAHILEGLLIAMDNMDEVVRIIRAASARDEARTNLIARFAFSEIQANAILEMRLYQLTGLERDKVQAEYDEIQKRIAYLKSLLADPKLIYGVIKDDLLEMKRIYGNPRRTEITSDDSEINFEDLIEDRDSVITISHQGYIKRVPADTYKEQRRGGRGIRAMSTKEEDFVENIFFASTHDILLCFTEKGRVFWKKVYEIPESPRGSKGKAIINLLDLLPDEKIATFIRIREFSGDQCLVFTTRNGTAKKTNLSAYKNVRSNGIKAINIDEGDLLINVRLTGENDELMLTTSGGMTVRFKESQLREMGRVSRGVRGIRLRNGQQLVSCTVVDPEATLMVVCENGFGKRSPISEYRETKRGGLGVRTILMSERNGPVVTAFTVQETDAIMLITERGVVIRMKVEDIRCMGRNTQGVRLVRLDESDRLVAAIPVERSEDEDEIETVKPEEAPGDDQEIPEEDLPEEDLSEDELDDDTDESDESDESDPEE
ncbi:MAG: DNA gyrase subunit A [Verrucomicrobia bacterium]|nr:DNA gyrase subunit A [Verrucomicrobiota bacterium]MCH8525907.1 DNA gyrase subunit A [Kiritimatiellia bacterium]